MLHTVQALRRIRAAVEDSVLGSDLQRWRTYGAASYALVNPMNGLLGKGIAAGGGVAMGALAMPPKLWR